MRKLITIMLVLCSACGRVPIRTGVSSSINDAIAKGDGTVIDLEDLADFAWDEVCVLGAFLRPVDITAALGFEWNGKRSGARGSLVFVDVRTPRSDSAATGHVPIGKNQWLIQASGCIPRQHAKFVVRSISGAPATLIAIDAAQQNQPLAPYQ